MRSTERDARRLLYSEDAGIAIEFAALTMINLLFPTHDHSAASPCLPLARASSPDHAQPGLSARFELRPWRGHRSPAPDVGKDRGLARHLHRPSNAAHASANLLRHVGRDDAGTYCTELVRRATLDG
jgi:hypothetical protein